MRDYQTKANQGSLPDSNSATKYGAGEANSLRAEAKNAVSRAGLTLAPQDGTDEDTTQLAQSLLINGVAAQAMQDSGVADAIVLTPVTGSLGLVLPPDYSALDGAEFSFFASFANATTAPTASIGQTVGSQIGAKTIVREDGSALAANDITTTIMTTLRRDNANDRWLLVRGAATRAVGGGGLIGYRVFNASGTYNKNPNAKSIRVTVVGAGGSGARCSSGNNATGGGAGGASIRLIDNASVGATEAITIGAGGAGQTVVGNGSPGGSSSFGAFCSASGGSGGLQGSGDVAAAPGGVGLNGDLNITGNPSSGGLDGVFTNVGTSGGGSIFCGGGTGDSLQNIGTNGGGSGSSGQDNSENGGDGVVVIEEYA